MFLGAQAFSPLNIKFKKMKTLVEIRDEYLKKLTDNTFGTNEQIPSGFSELDKLTGGIAKES